MVIKMNETQEQLEKSIRLTKHRLKQFTAEKLVSDEANIAFNRLLIEKAVLVKKLHDIKVNPIKAFIAKFIRKTTGKTLICDRF